MCLRSFTVLFFKNTFVYKTHSKFYNILLLIFNIYYHEKTYFNINVIKWNFF
jgi:hypothetical protein